ncbi:OSBP1-like protein [Mya arenaria]|uniref:OSBP1-like protein n=1 Tax=Mya arenaria TaxID=6604 RepID=A0ABY7E412_MYAAR|nr:OSBP1-like protein [Mya arenaria]
MAVATFLTAVLARFLFTYGWSWNEGMMFGAILSATDPVAVVALLRDIGASKKLAMVIEGEALLNDGAAIVFFNVFLNLVTSDEGISVCGVDMSPIVRGVDMSPIVTGMVTDASSVAKWYITGTWDTQMDIAQVLQVDESAKRPVIAHGPKRTIWKRVEPPPGDKMYYFTQLALQLNEPEEGVAPTDARNRPDQRAMEIGAWDEANRIKVQLEEKQRARRKKMEAEAEAALKRGEEPPVHKPMWFERSKDPVTAKVV